jgi:hypothetical protein
MLLNETDANLYSGRKQLVGLHPRYLVCFPLYVFTRVAGRAGAQFRTILPNTRKVPAWIRVRRFMARQQRSGRMNAQ